MRKSTLFILLTCSSWACAQELSVHVGGALGASYAEVQGRSLDRGVPGLAYAVTLQVERRISDFITAGAGCAFRSEVSTYAVSGITPGYGDSYLSLATTLVRRSLLFPVQLDIGTSPEKFRGMHFLVCVSAITSLPSDLRIDSVFSYPGNSRVAPLVEDRIRLRRENGSAVGIRYQLGMAKDLLFRDRRLRLKVGYSWDGDRWLCPTVNDPFNAAVPLKGHVLEFGADWQL